MRNESIFDIEMEVSNSQEHNPSPAYSKSLSRSQSERNDPLEDSRYHEFNPADQKLLEAEEQIKQDEPQKSHKSEEESEKQVVKTKKNKKTKKHLDEELARAAVEQLIPQMAQSIEDDRQSIIRKQSGWLISS